jgi:prophage antirepressor-like protein
MSRQMESLDSKATGRAVKSHETTKGRQKDAFIVSAFSLHQLLLAASTY